jgi:hypothetical protein
MNKRKSRIRFAWVILICFIAGQTMVYSHQHFHYKAALSTSTVKNTQSGTTVTDSCSICDMMHHTHMVIFDNATINPPVTLCETIYNNQHDYKGIALILSAGRSPPTV